MKKFINFIVGVVLAFSGAQVIASGISGGTVSKTTAQTITGEKTFSAPVTATGGITASTITATGGITSSTITATADVTVQADLISTKACATNYTRVSPNYCVFSGAIGSVLLTVKDACTAIPAPSPSAIAIVVRRQAQSGGSNSAGYLRNTNFGVYDSAACNSPIMQTLRSQANEQVSTTAVLDVVFATDTGVLSSPGASAYYYFSDDPGNNGYAIGEVVGYYD